MSRIRRLALLATILVAASLSGCSVIGSGGTVIGFLGDDVSRDNALSSLAGSVRELPAVASVDNDYLTLDDVTSPPSQQGPVSPRAKLTITLTQTATEHQAAVIAESARKGLAAKVFDSVQPWLTIGTASHRLKVTAQLAKDELERDVHFWWATSAALHGTVVVAVPGAGSEGVMVSEVPDARGDFPSLTALREASKDAPSSTIWGVAGLLASGSLPPSDYDELFTKTAAIASPLPLTFTANDELTLTKRNFGTGGLVVRWTDRFSNYGPVVGWNASTTDNAQLARGVLPVEALDVARLVASSAQPVSFLIAANLPHGASAGGVHFGACPKAPEVSAGDTTLVSQLAAAGIRVSTANAGACQYRG